MKRGLSWGPLGWPRLAHSHLPPASPGLGVQQGGGRAASEHVCVQRASAPSQTGPVPAGWPLCLQPWGFRPLFLLCLFLAQAAPTPSCVPALHGVGRTLGLGPAGPWRSHPQSKAGGSHGPSAGGKHLLSACRAHGSHKVPSRAWVSSHPSLLSGSPYLTRVCRA